MKSILRDRYLRRNFFLAIGPILLSTILLRTYVLPHLFGEVAPRAYQLPGERQWRSDCRQSLA